MAGCGWVVVVRGVRVAQHANLGVGSRAFDPSLTRTNAEVFLRIAASLATGGAERKEAVFFPGAPISMNLNDHRSTALGALLVSPPAK